jgi:hypothetical protein
MQFGLRHLFALCATVCLILGGWRLASFFNLEQHEQGITAVDLVIGNVVAATVIVWLLSRRSK